MENKHILPKDIFVGENEYRFTLLHERTYKTLGTCEWDILDKVHSGTNAKITATEICKRYNSHTDLLTAAKMALEYIGKINSGDEGDQAYQYLEAAINKATQQ